MKHAREIGDQLQQKSKQASNPRLLSFDKKPANCLPVSFSEYFMLVCMHVFQFVYFALASFNGLFISFFLFTLP